MSNGINFTKLSQICTCQSWYIPVYTGMDKYILVMNWSVQVQTSTNRYILVCTCINTNMTLSQCTYRGHTLSYWYSPSLIRSKKSVRRTRTRDLLHTVRRILPCTTGVHTLTLECWPILFWVYIDICIICAPSAWCRIDGASPAAPCWARNMWQFNNIHFTQLGRLNLNTCCWRDLFVSSLCWNSDVLQPMLCMAYVRWELCTKCTATVHDS